MDGGWTSWTSWSPCPGRCGPGTRTRTRTCTNPPPRGLGRGCGGGAEQLQHCRNLCVVAGGWAAWAPWSSCSRNCTQLRRRACTSPAPANGGAFCRGADTARGACGGGQCRDTRSLAAADSQEVVVTDLSLVVGLGVAVTVFLCVTGAAVRVIRSKRPGHSVYNMAELYYGDQDKDTATTATTAPSTRGKWHETNFSWPGARVAGLGGGPGGGADSDKQLLRHAADWPGSVQTTPQLASTPRRQVRSPSRSEHQYDVPWSHLLPRRHLEQGAGTNDYSELAGLVREPAPRPAPASPWSVSDTSLSLSSGSGSVSGLGGGPPPLQLAPDSFTVASVTHTGARLALPGWGVALLVPPGALEPGYTEEVFLAVVAAPAAPAAGPDSCQLSCVVLAGPPRLQLSKAAVVSLAHSCGGGGAQDRWEAGVWHSSSLAPPSPRTQDWALLAGLDTGAGAGAGYAVLEQDTCHVATTSLGHFCLAGGQRAGEEAAVRGCRLVTSCRRGPGPRTLAVRLSLVPDTAGSVEAAVRAAERTGGQLLGKPRQLGLQCGAAELRCAVASTAQVTRDQCSVPADC